MAKIEWREIEGEKWFKFNSRFDYFKYYWGHWVSIILFIVVITGCVFIGYYIITNKTAFFENPIVYGIKQLEDKNDGVISCNCFITREDFSFNSFVLDRDGVHLNT